MKNLYRILATAFFTFASLANLVFASDFPGVAGNLGQPDKGFMTDGLLDPG